MEALWWRMPPRLLIAVLFFALPSLAAGRAVAEADFVEGEVLVVFKAGLRENSAKSVLGRHSLKLERQFRRVSAQRGRVTGLVRNKKLGTARLIERLKTDPDVASVEPNYLRRFSAVPPNDADFPKLWGLKNTGQTVDFTAGTSGVDTNFLPAWELARPAGGEVIVGVVDSGVDFTHPDLAANIWTNPGEIADNGIDDDGNGYVDDVHGYDFRGNTADVTDSGHHGTHVAGTIAAVGKNGIGITGVARRTKILPLKISNDGVNIAVSAAIDACEYALALKQGGVNIVALNGSYGGPYFSNAEKAAIDALQAEGIIFCAAAGNMTKNNESTPSYPANYASGNIITVAAITQTNTLAWYSNYGATTVDLAAPGSNIYSARPQNEVATQSAVTAGVASYASQTILYAGTTPVAGSGGTIHHCGLGYPEDFPPAVAGNIALIERGTLTFAAKVANATAAGAIAAIIYDNVAGGLGDGWTLGSSGNRIPAVQVTQTSGQAILAALPASGTVTNFRDNTLIYQFLDGTSMATPHVTGAVAFAALNFPSETMADRINRILGNTTAVPALAGKTVTGGRLDLLKMIDTDNDGLPDWWEMENLGSLAGNADDDGDADGFSNLDEFLAGTDPDDPASQLAFTAAAALVDGPETHFTLTFPSVLDRCYQIEWSETLQPGSWQPLGAPVTGTGALMQVQDPEAIQNATRRFYRMTVLED
jgi:subtilisin family serine protease